MANSNGRLAGKVAVITGAGRKKGLGEAIATRFSEEGATVVITDIGKPSGDHLPAGNIGTSEEMEEVADGVRSSTGGTIHTMVCDVRSEDDVIRTIADTVKTCGRLDIVVNNAGIGYIMKPLMELSIDEWDVVLDVNLRGPFLFTKHAAAQFVRQGEGGRIINIASQAAKSPAPLLIHYTSSKHGMIGLTRTAAVELGEHGITSNAVCPNHVTTGLGAVQNARRGEVLGTDTEGVLDFRKTKIPLGRVGLPSDTANACVFFASDDASYITGESINVTGGEEMH
ncbi:MAG: SDR family NAD(P)-dependent oxidoreductase [Rhodospirillaceae bacterium]|jgi:NAD(P)-dependent dehydrogenase (short-subunit alcohol dehydrogenase family)|nr:SDR family NAD(P)-dependent oxidoreductase [Rhodospirillaceae bacterium]